MSTTVLSRQTERERAVTTKTATKTASKRAAAKPKVDTVTALVEIMSEQLAEAGVKSRSAAESMSVDQRDVVLGVAAWGGDEDTAWAQVLDTLPDDDSDDDDEQTTAVPLRPLTTDPELQKILDTIAGDTPQAVDYAYRDAFRSCCVGDAKVPPREVMTILAEQHRRVHEQFVTSRAKKRGSKSEPKPKTEFQPFVMLVLEWMEQHFTEHGAAVGLRVKDIAEGMGKHTGTVWHAVKILTAARRLRPMPEDAKRFTFFPSAQPVEAVTAS